jgi:adenylate kinase
MAMEPTIALLGPPGSGKGTQAQRLRDRDGYVTLSTGDLLRAAVAAGTEVGRAAAGYMERGELVPDELILGLLRDELRRHEPEPILLDGFPRTLPQAKALEDELPAHGRALSALVLIDVPEDVVVERIAQRGQGRADDDPETVRERMRVYHRETEPLIGYYADRGLLRRVDGRGDPDAVAAAVQDALRDDAA